MPSSKDVFSTFESEVKTRHDEMLADLESISVDNLKTEGVTLSFGGKTFKFTDLEVIENSETEDKIRKEFKDKLNAQQQLIRDKINSKINQLLMMHQTKIQEFDRKERELKRKYSEAALMPDINQNHMVQGLSVIKGNSNDELVWVYRAEYNPKFVATRPSGGGEKVRKVIPSRLVNRMKKQILILITTKGNNITDVSTKDFSSGNSLSRFKHYHQTGTSDCWGSWKYSKRWNTPDDILFIAKNAEAVLEVINHSSIADRNPTGLPRLDTLMKLVKDIREVPESEFIVNDDDDPDVWHS